MSSLANQRILVVEDEFLISAMLCDMLFDAEAVVVGPAASVSAALRLVQDNDVDCAILDMNLNGEWSDPIADELDRKGVPFIFTTGYGATERSERWKVRTVSKPYAWEEVEALLLLALSESAGEKAV
jgi:DNA-binding response OmpR family regulator